MRPLPNIPFTFPTIASPALRAVSPSRPSARPPRRGRLVHFYGRHLEHDPASCRFISSLPFRFQTGSALFAKRQPRPFPPPFLSPPSGSFSDPLSTHDRSRDRGAVVDGELIRGRTNGDDAVYESDFLICANDGVGAWATRPRGHAGLWSRLILHYWATAAEIAAAEDKEGQSPEPTPTKYLQSAYERTLEITTKHNWQGTTTACGAQLYFRPPKDLSSGNRPTPLLYITNLGDCQVLVLRPSTREVLYKTQEQWHWFDCPHQLGTNSPDTPENSAVTDTIDIEVGDVVLAMTDGVIDNLWQHEIVDTVVKSIEAWEKGNTPKVEGDRTGGRNGGMRAAAQDLVAAAKKIAMDPFAESPFMEHAIEEGLASEGGKLDDISVVAALCVAADDA